MCNYNFCNLLCLHMDSFLQLVAFDISKYMLQPLGWFKPDHDTTVTKEQSYHDATSKRIKLLKCKMLYKNCRTYAKIKPTAFVLLYELQRIINVYVYDLIDLTDLPKCVGICSSEFK